MTQREVVWATRHDWFISYARVSDNDNDYIVHVQVRGGGTQFTKSFVDFIALQNWAGY